jgi:hypothetical protein
MQYATAQDLYDALSAPFPVEMIEWRVGSTNKEKTKCLPLCYIDARAVMDRLDTMCGPDGWQCNYSPGVNGSIICNIGIELPNGWLWKADGAGATDIEGEKGALSDAFKRAAVRWGVGRYLYDLKAPWVGLENGKFISEDDRKKLDNLHEEFAQRCGWGIRAGVQAYKLLNQAIVKKITDPVEAVEFRESNASMIAQLPVGMRKHLNDQLDRVGATSREAAE